MADGAPRARASRAGLLTGTSAALAALEKRVAALSMAVIVVAIGVTVLTRLLNLPLPSLGEIAIVAMSPLTFVGGAYCSHLHQHLSIDIVDTMPDGPLKTLIHMAAALSMAGFAGTFAWLAWNLFSYAWASGERLIDLGTPIWIPTGFIFLGSALMCVHAVIDILGLSFVRSEGTVG